MGGYRSPRAYALRLRSTTIFANASKPELNIQTCHCHASSRLLLGSKKGRVWRAVCTDQSGNACVGGLVGYLDLRQEACGDSSDGRDGGHSKSVSLVGSSVKAPWAVA